MQLSKVLFVAVMLAAATVLGLVLCKSIRNGHGKRSAVLMFATSAGIMLFAWLVVQRAQPGTVDLGSMSYTAVVGDIIVLPTVGYLAARGWRACGDQLDNSFWESRLWLYICMASGLALGIAFHRMGGASSSQSPDLAVRLHDSATSWAHNLGVFPAIAGALLYTVVPLLVTNSPGRSWAMAATAFIVIGWGGLSIIDVWRASLPVGHHLHFNPHWLDVEMDWNHWQPRNRN